MDTRYHFLQKKAVLQPAVPSLICIPMLQHGPDDFSAAPSAWTGFPEDDSIGCRVSYFRRPKKYHNLSWDWSDKTANRAGWYDNISAGLSSSNREELWGGI